MHAYGITVGESCSLLVLNAAMSVILQLNRDFPFQVALSFDDAAMDVLDWLEEQSLAQHASQIFGSCW